MTFDIFYPVKPFVITQGFGENKGCIDNATNSNVIACDGHNPPAGYRSIYSMMNGHNGIDLITWRGQPVYASQEGRVLRVETEEALGLGVVLLHGPYDGRYYKTRYWHLKGMEVQPDEPVSSGTLLGYADDTGFSAGDHLHFDLKECDSKGNTLNHNNGYFGAIDPMPFFNGYYAVDSKKVLSLLNTTISLLQTFVNRLKELAKQ